MECDKDLPTDMLHDCDDLLHTADGQLCILVVMIWRFVFFYLALRRQYGQVVVVVWERRSPPMIVGLELVGDRVAICTLNHV